MSEYINKIKIGNTEYDIQASSIGTVSEINITDNTESIINFTTGTGASAVTGSVGLNSKGNLSVESLTKHVNLEAAKSIQMKPTNSIIIDTTRKIKNDSGDNEANIKVVYDDYEKDGSPANQDPYGYLKIHSRAIDLRCYGHGGIALQPSGHDSSNHENKIKFESDRKVSANATVNPNTDYAGEGGKGVEFGTFNNEHTSIFTKDYRFNEEGKVYSVTRGTITTNSKGKSDYPTQNDDFKDILRTNKDTDCTCNSSGVWSVNDPSKEYIMGATWKSIVKTANALNDREWTDTNISGSGNLQITVADEIEWVATEDNGHAIVLAANKQDPKRKYVGDGNVYKLTDNNFYTCELKTNGEHHLNLESEGTVKIESGYDDIELNAGDKVQAVAPIVQFEASEQVDFSTSPIVSFMYRKVNKNGIFEGSNPKLQITSLNNFGKTVYDNTTTGKIRIPNDEYLYDETGNQYKPGLVVTSKPAVYTDSSHTIPAPGRNYVYTRGGIVLMITVEYDEAKNKSEAKKWSTICTNTVTPLCIDSGFQTAFNPTTDYSESVPTLYTAANTTAEEGYYITQENDTKYIIYVNSNHQLAQFNVGNNSTELVWNKEFDWFETTKHTTIDFSVDNIIYGGSNSAQTNEEAVNNGEQLKTGNIECNIRDIIDLVNLKEDLTTLVNYFKDGAGQANGPWANA